MEWQGVSASLKSECWLGISSDASELASEMPSRCLA